MDFEALFSALGGLALVGWLPLLVAPGWKPTRLGVPLLVTALLSGTYVALLAYALPRADGGFGSLADVSLLFDTPAALLAGWVHYLAFDLFIGAWIVHDARRLVIPHAAVAPALVLTFLAGPAGLLTYLALRFTLRHGAHLHPGGSDGA